MYLAFSSRPDIRRFIFLLFLSKPQVYRQPLPGTRAMSEEHYSPSHFALLAPWRENNRSPYLSQRRKAREEQREDALHIEK